MYNVFINEVRALAKELPVKIYRQSASEEALVGESVKNTVVVSGECLRFSDEQTA